MKKLVYSLAVLFSVALVSCGGNKAEGNDSDTVVADSNVAESVVAESGAVESVQVVEAAEVVVDSVAK